MLWGMAAGMLAVGMEVAYRKHWLAWNNDWVVVIIPISLLLNYCIWRLITGQPSYLGALVWFGMVTATMRIAASFLLLQEPIDYRMLVGAGALIVASVVKTL